MSDPASTVGAVPITASGTSVIGTHPYARRASSPKPIIANGQGSFTHSNDTAAHVRAVEFLVPSAPLPLQSTTQETPAFSSIDDLQLGQPIGYGSSAVVYSAIYKPLNKRVAVKIIDLDLFERNQIDELRREIALMTLSKHPNVLQVYGSFVNNSKLYIVTPFLAGGSCLDIMKNGFPDGLDELSIASILKCTLDALSYLHKNGHIHRDIKAGNLLMDSDGSVMLGDFGVSSSLTENGERGMRRTFVGTPCWMAPEVMEQAAYDDKADIWSFGITAIELANGHAPFAKYPPLKVLMKTLSSDPPTLTRETATHSYSKAFKDMVDICLNKDHTKRPTAEQLLHHPFFRQAKKKEYLTKTLLSNVLPLEERPRKKIPQKCAIYTTTEAWDFDELTDDSARRPSHESAEPQTLPPKRHISFGEAVIKDPHPLHITPEGSRRSSSVSDDARSSTGHGGLSCHPTMITSATTAQEPDAFLDAPKPGIGGLATEAPSSQFLSTESSIDQCVPVRETRRKSRFEVQSTGGLPLSRENSVSAIHQREGSVDKTHGYPTVDRAKEPESGSSSSLEPRIVGRFKLIGGATDKSSSMLPPESPYLSASNSSGTLSPLISPLSGQTPRPNSEGMATITAAQLDELVRQNTVQRQILLDLCKCFQGKPKQSREPALRIPGQEYADGTTRSGLHHSFHLGETATASHTTLQEHLLSAWYHLDQLIHSALRENTSLHEENEALRRELDQLQAAKDK